MAKPNSETGGFIQAERVSRYPGVQPFGDGAIDRQLFRGRDEEKYELLQLVLAERLVLVFARSGIGKSSLINAGLLEPLRDKGYFPIVARVSGSAGSPLDCVYASIKAAVGKASEHGGIEYEPRAPDWDRTSLWHFFKTFEIWRNDALLSPVLVIDQFEELFTLYGVEQRKPFIHELADLVRGTRPRDTSKEVSPNLSDAPPEIKVVVALREDFYANLEELRDRIPAIYKAPFRLKPLSRQQAKRAIAEPAALEGEYFSTPAFRWSEEALEKVLDFLSEQQLGEGKTKVGREVEPFQLQLICQHVEEKVRQENLKTVNVNDLGGAEALKAVLSSFYEASLRKVCAKFPDEQGLQERLERLCEYGFITAKGRRLLREESTIKQDDGVGPEILREMVELRVLRKEPRVGDNYYELTHDTLIEPIQLSRQAREDRKAQEAHEKLRKRLTLGGIAATVLLAGFLGWALLERAKVSRVAEAKQHAVAAQQVAEQQAKRAEREAERALAAERQALEERQESAKVAVKARLEAGEEEARRRQAQAEAKLAEIQPLAVAAQKKVAEAKLQLAEATGQDYENEAKQLVAEAESELQTALRQVELAQKAVLAAKTRVMLIEATRENVEVKLAASQNKPAEEQALAVRGPAAAAGGGTETVRQAEASESSPKRLAEAKTPVQKPPPAAKVEKPREEEDAERKTLAKVDLAALEARETEPETTDAQLAMQYREFLNTSGSGLSPEEVQGIESKIRELEQASMTFAALKRNDEDPTFSLCEAFDQWSAYQPRRALSPEAQYRDLRLAELNALLQDNAVVTTQKNFITSTRKDDPRPSDTFGLGRDRVYIHAWINAPRTEAVRLKVLRGDTEESIWNGKKVARNPLRGVRMGYHLWTYKGANATGLHELRLYNAKNALICRREFEVVETRP